MKLGIVAKLGLSLISAWQGWVCLAVAVDGIWSETSAGGCDAAGSRGLGAGEVSLTSGLCVRLAGHACHGCDGDAARPTVGSQGAERARLARPVPGSAVVAVAGAKAAGDPVLLDAGVLSENAPGSPYAVEVVEFMGPFGMPPYDAPASLLGIPATDFHDAWGAVFGGGPQRKVKLVEPAYDWDATRTRKLVTTLGEGSSVVVRFERPITDDPGHPYGIDLIVFGNAYYAAAGFVDDQSDMNTLELIGGGVFEGLKVAVSPGFTGAAGQDPTKPSSWEWYRYENGPYADAAFPTQAYRWNRAESTWGSELMDFTKPVNPAFGPRLEGGGMSAADAIDLYDGSGGGTGFDISESGFPWIHYVRIEGLAGFAEGEIDGLAAVRPAILGDSLTVARGTEAGPGARLLFQDPAHPGQATVGIGFQSIDGDVRVSTKGLSGSDTVPAGYGRVLIATELGIGPLLGTNTLTYSADLGVRVGADYGGDGRDLVLLRKSRGDWEAVPVAYDGVTRSFVVPVVSGSLTLALVQLVPPRLGIERTVDEAGRSAVAVRLPVLPGFLYELQRSDSPLFGRVETVATVSPDIAQEMTLLDRGQDGGAMYRVRVSRR